MFLKNFRCTLSGSFSEFFITEVPVSYYPKFIEIGKVKFDDNHQLFDVFGYVRDMQIFGSEPMLVQLYAILVLLFLLM